jgi:hypothetical protein
MTDWDPSTERLTRPAPDEIEPGIPATTDMPRPIPAGDEDEEQPAPLDHPQGVETWGTTAREEELGEPLAVRVRREQPEDTRLRGPEGMSLYEPGADGGLFDAVADDEADAIGDVDEDREYTLPAEEAAIRIEREPGGLTDDEGPGYLDRE